MHATVRFTDGTPVPSLGLGTWRLGEDSGRRAVEVRAMRAALAMGWRALDTAEMYGEGGAEEVLGLALAEAWREGLAREDVFVVSKVYPHHASPRGMLEACERSLRRLQLDQMDLYLLHWRGRVPLAETVEGFETLQRRGWIRRWGVSNFDIGDLLELDAVPGGQACAANQVYYSLGSRGIEFDLLPLQQRRGLPLMAYSPIDQGELSAHPALRAVADRHGATPAQVALAWTLSRPGVMPIPMSAREEHLRENLAAAALRLSTEDHATLDAVFPPQRRKTALKMR